MTTQNLPPRQASRLAEIERQLVDLQREKRELDSRRIAADRAARTRRCVIVGTWLEVNEPATFQRVVDALVRPQDRAAFGLEPLPDVASEPKADAIADATLGPA